MNVQVKSLKVSSITHRHLQRLGRSGDTMDSVIISLIMEHIIPKMNDDFIKIRELCGDLDANKIGFDEIFEKTASIFNEISFDRGIYPEWELKDAIEMAMDEDMVGMIREDTVLPLSEVIINCYCLYLEMPSPTFGNGLMLNPLSP